MKGMKIDYILPRLLTLFYIQDPTVDENSEKCKLYKENVDKFRTNFNERVRSLPVFACMPSSFGHCLSSLSI